MEIPEFVPVDEQACILGNHKWNVEILSTIPPKVKLKYPLYES